MPALQHCAKGAAHMGRNVSLPNDVQAVEPQTTMGASRAPQVRAPPGPSNKTAAAPERRLLCPLENRESGPNSSSVGGSSSDRQKPGRTSCQPVYTDTQA